MNLLVSGILCILSTRMIHEPGKKCVYREQDETDVSRVLVMVTSIEMLGSPRSEAACYGNLHG